MTGWEALREIGRVALGEAWRMGWFTLLGVGVAALIKTYQWDRKVRVYVGRAGPWGILIATAVGTLSPLCSCGILPVVIPMALSGVPLPPLMALLVTSPVMDPASFALTWGGVGPALAWWKLGGAVFLGLLAGFGTLALERAGVLGPDLLRLRPVYTPEGELAPAYEIACANGFRVRTMTVMPRDSRLRFFLDRFWDVGSFVFLWVGVAILLEAVIQVLVPTRWLVWLGGQGGPLGVLVATAVALPLPLHQVPVVPVLAGLQAKGLGAGPDLAFLMAGPVTSIPASATLAAMFRPRVLGVYLGLGLLGSAALGLARWALATP
ncbi:permease [Deferrisoma camini]|uniref:permease n=1 Tax=Deferrisoma camini TaxID=1035120 RepID=UPI00046D5606|nr:permease [Deferrisoma camini]